MSRIGFKQAHEQGESIVTAVPKINSVTDLAESIGALKAMEVLEGYFNPAFMPFIKGDKRDQMFIGKLRKIKERYFDPI